MGGWVTWVGIGISGFIAGYEAIIASDPKIAVWALGVGTIVVGVARKIEKAIKAFRSE